MTALPAFGNPEQTINMTPDPAVMSGFTVLEKEWGYIIRSSDAAPVVTHIVQSIASLIGLSLAVAAIGLWTVPGSALGAEMAVMKVGASVMLASIAAFLFYFATRGSLPELQIDVVKSEIREVLRTKRGKSTVADRYSFCAMSQVFIDRSERRDGRVRLLMRYRNTNQTLLVASGQEYHLADLRDRIGADLMGGWARARKAERAQLRVAA